MPTGSAEDRSDLVSPVLSAQMSSVLSVVALGPLAELAFFVPSRKRWNTLASRGISLDMACPSTANTWQAAVNSGSGCGAAYSPGVMVSSLVLIY